jgi:integrase
VIGAATLSDADGWKRLGKLGIDIKNVEPEKATFGQIAAYYFRQKEWRKASTKSLHRQIVNDILVPRWGNRIAVEIKPKEIRDWLKKLEVRDPTRYKYKTVMGTVYAFAQSEDQIPIKDGSNPISFVKGITACSDYEAIVLSPSETLLVLENLEQPEYTLLLLVACTGLRISEALGLRWQDLIHDRNEIKLRQTYVYGIVQAGTKTIASRASVPMHPVLSACLQAWQSETPYAAATDYIFASFKLGGKKPRTGSMIVEGYLPPAAIAAKVITVTEDGTTLNKDGVKVTRFGFHSFRHSLASTLMERGEDPALVQGFLRHAKLNMTLYYSHAQKHQKVAVQGAMLEQLLPKTESLQ